MSAVKNLFKPKLPEIKPTNMPTPAAAANAGQTETPALNFSSLISTSAGGLKRKANTAKRSLLGGS